MSPLLILLISYCFVALLFWKKAQITILVFFHSIFVGILIANADFTSDVFAVFEVVANNELEVIKFDYMQAIAICFTIPISMIWFYQWWFVGKQREKLFSHSV